jgi:flagellar biosynthesis anti-sigma factor FlgM
MRISRIGTLFAANIDSVSSRSQSKNTQSSDPATAVTQSEAVVLSPRFNRPQQNPEETEEARAARLKEIRRQVARGDYQADANKVAEALYRDLL